MRAGPQALLPLLLTSNLPANLRTIPDSRTQTTHVTTHMNYTNTHNINHIIFDNTSYESHSTP